MIKLRDYLGLKQNFEYLFDYLCLGPQCYVKPSGKSNRKIIVNAISHVCLSGTVNQDQKEKCLQVCESGVPVPRVLVHFIDRFFQTGLFGFNSNPPPPL